MPLQKEPNELGYVCREGDKSCELYSDYEVLRALPVFERVSTEIVKLWAYFSRRLAFEEGRPLVSCGEPVARAHCLVSGTARVLLPRGEDPVEVLTLNPGDVFGELALLADLTAQVDVVAQTRVVALTLDKRNFWKVYEQFPDQTRHAVEQIVQLRVGWQQKALTRNLALTEDEGRLAGLARGLLI